VHVRKARACVQSAYYGVRAPCAYTLSMHGACAQCTWASPTSKPQENQNVENRKNHNNDTIQHYGFKCVIFMSKSDKVFSWPDPGPSMLFEIMCHSYDYHDSLYSDSPAQSSSKSVHLATWTPGGQSKQKAEISKKKWRECLLKGRLLIFSPLLVVVIVGYLCSCVPTLQG
jgi:hypothetical protein